VRLPLVTALLYQREFVPVSAFHDVRSAFLAFLGKKLLAGMASELGRRIAGNFLEYSPGPCRIGKSEGGGDFGYAPGAGAEKVLGLRDSSAVEIILIGQAHRLPEYSGKVRGRQSDLTDNGVEADIGSVVIVDKTNGLLDLMIMTEGDGGRWRSRLSRLIGLGKDVLSARWIGSAEWLLKIITGVASECIDRTSSSPYAMTMITRTEGAMSLISFMMSMPDMSGSRTSGSNTSGAFPPLSWAVIRRQDCCCGCAAAAG
jgi:hypothetical protein